VWSPLDAIDLYRALWIKIVYLLIQIIKKLTGQTRGTTLLVSNIGNEMGQVLMSVLTASEGVGL